MQNFQNNEQLRFPVQLIVEALLTGKLESLVCTLVTLVTSQKNQQSSCCPYTAFSVLV